MRRALPLRLHGDLDAGQDRLGLLRHRLVPRPHHDRRGHASGFAHRMQHMRQQRAPADPMQHFRRRRAHARALAGGENDGKAAAIGHGVPLAPGARALIAERPPVEKGTPRRR